MAKNSEPRLAPARVMHDLGLRPWQLHSAALASVGLCLALWIVAKTEDQEQRGNAERRAVFVGLWPPTFHLLGDALARYERERRRWPAR